MGATSTLGSIIMIISVAYAFTFPLLGDVSSLMGQKSEYDDTLAKAQKIEDQKNNLLAEFNQISAANIQKVDTLIPDSFDYVKLVSDIDGVASRYGLFIDKVSSTGEVDPAQSIEEAQNAPAYKSGKFKFSFTSSYQNGAKFMDALETSLRILDIRSMQITPLENGLYKYEVEFETYWAR